MRTWSSSTHLVLSRLLQVIATRTKLLLTRSSPYYQFSSLFTAPCVGTLAVSPHNWSERIMETYQPDTSINNVLVTTAVSSLSNVKSPQTPRINFRCLGALRKGESCRWAKDVCEAEASRSRNDLISRRNLCGCEASKSAFLTLPHQRTPLESLRVSLKALPYISWSPKCVFLWQPLLFLAPLFHLSDSLSFSSPPLPASVCHTPPPPHLSACFYPTNVPVSFLPAFFLICLLLCLPPMVAISEYKDRREILWPAKLHLIFCIPAMAFVSMCLCGPHSSSALLLYLGRGYRDKQKMHHCTVCAQWLAGWYGAN